MQKLILVLVACLMALGAQAQGLNLDSLKTIAQGLNGIEKARYYKEIGFGYSRKQEYDSAAKYYNLTIPIAESENALELLSQAYNGLGATYYSRGSYKSAILYYELAIEFFQTDDKGKEISMALINLGLAYKGINNYGKAVNNLQDGIKGLSPFGDYFSKYSSAIAYNALGNIHRAL